jgi:ubiquinone/menaquinone biosynthesis C-methylase UbiE
MHRVVIPELLDTDAGTPLEIQNSLADLLTINRYFGGLRTMTELASEVAERKQIQSLSWLDVGGGNGELISLTAQSLRDSGIQLQPVLLDRIASHMTSPTINGHYPGISGDALALPFKDSSFDVVACCLFLHHLEPQQVVEFMNEGLRVARHAVLINDLIRHPLHLGLAYLGYAIYRSRLTRHDAVASVRRAYTVEEIKSMMRQTAAAETKVRRFFPFRMGVIAWKRPSTI